MLSEVVGDHFFLVFMSEHGPISSMQPLDEVFFFLEFARSWKNFVLASPKRIYVSLERWRILDFSIIANPTERTFSRLRSSSSSCDSDLSSWAVSRRRMISLTIASCSFVSPIFVFFAPLDSFSCPCHLNVQAF